MKIKQHSAINKTCISIVECMKPLLWIEYCYGIFRCRLGGRSSDAIDTRMKLLGVAISAMWLIVFYCFSPPIEELFRNACILTDYFVSVLLRAEYAISIIILLLWQTQSNQKVIKMFAGIDISLFAGIDENFYKMSSNQCKKFFALYVLLFVICITLYIYLFMGHFRINHIMFTIIYFERKIELFVFCQVLFMLKQRLLLINSYLSKITENQNRGMFVQNMETRLDINFIGHISNTNYRIRDLASVYCKLGKVCLLINNIYNSLLLMIFVTAFVVILTISSTVLCFYKLGASYLFSLLMLYFISAELLSIITISYHCESVIDAKKEIKETLYRIISLDDLPTSMRNQAEVFVELTKIWHLSINVFDMFDVNLKLVLKFISIATTYLIVIIQIYHLI
nr:gustatory receptor 23 [Papilio glaucus]